MKYLSIFGSEGFRTFRGLLTGKLLYAPEKIPMIDPEITSERDFSIRLQDILSPYMDDHPKLKDLTPLLSEKMGEIYEINPNLAIWRPKIHLASFGEELVASLIDNFIPELLNNPLFFISELNDSGSAFVNAFSIEQKTVFFPSFLKESIMIPKINDKTKIVEINTDKKNWNKIRNTFTQNQMVLFDSNNFFRIIGHMITIIQVLCESERKRIRFYNDPVVLVLPADNMEYILAAYYLSRSNFPITKIYALSSDNRMIHNLLERGEFTLNDIPQNNCMISLYRFLFEASRASIEKLSLWKKELQNKGSFTIDSTSLDNIKKIITPIFTTKNYYADVEDTTIINSRISKTAYTLSKNGSELLLAFDLQNPDFTDNKEVSSILSETEFLKKI